MSFRSGGERGVTLLEVMIVAAIIVMLVAISVPMYSNAVRKSRSTALAAECRKFYTALMSYHADHSSFPSEAAFNTTTLNPLASQGYITAVESFTQKLMMNRVLIYLAPDVEGVDQHFITVMRHADDPSIVVVVGYTNIIAAAGGWIDGVYVISEGELAEADDIL